MPISTETITCYIDTQGVTTGHGTFQINIPHLVSKIIISHGACVGVVAADNLLLVTSSLINGKTMGLMAGGQISRHLFGILRKKNSYIIETSAKPFKNVFLITEPW